MTSYRGDANAAPISIAQQARPHWKHHSEYVRDRLSSHVKGFGIVTLVARAGDQRTGLDAYRGLGQRRPGLALLFTVFLLAQAGVPLTSGFLAKFYVISAAVEAHSYALAIIAMLAAVIAAFFYLRVIVVMYMAGDEAAAAADAGPIAIPVGAGLSLAVSVVATLVIGTVLAGPAFDFARHASVLRL